MSEEPQDRDDAEVEPQEAVLLPPREAMSLINPAPGDMPVDPPPVPGPIGPLDDIT